MRNGAVLRAAKAQLRSCGDSERRSDKWLHVDFDIISDGFLSTRVFHDFRTSALLNVSFLSPPPSQGCTLRHSRAGRLKQAEGLPMCLPLVQASGQAAPRAECSPARRAPRGSALHPGVGL